MKKRNHHLFKRHLQSEAEYFDVRERGLEKKQSSRTTHSREILCNVRNVRRRSHANTTRYFGIFEISKLPSARSISPHCQNILFFIHCLHFIKGSLRSSKLQAYSQSQGKMSGPNLSQYFSQNPPSLFDEIGGGGG